MARKHSKRISKKTVICITGIVLALLLAVIVTVLLLHILEKNNLNEPPSETESVISSLPCIASSEVISEESSSTVASTVNNVTKDLKKQSDEIKQTKENTVKVNKTDIDFSVLKQRSVRLAVNYLPQNPELPTGCEITSLTTVLNFYGYTVSKTTMADKYLDKQNAPADWTKVFMGTPFDEHSFGCYAQPITNAANRFFADNKNKHIAYNKSGIAFSAILSEIDNGRPVVIWGTMSMKEAYKTVKFNIDGKTMQWIAPEHCLVLIGYDIDRGVAVMSDPQKGIVEYNIYTVKQRYESMCSQCVFIRENENYVEEEPPIGSEEESNSSETVSEQEEQTPTESSKSEDTQTEIETGDDD
ncbi:MAG: C39 family peptidase [Clostridia bacterium]|nr:C39 family peptidase [Clostridia bacterium]